MPISLENTDFRKVMIYGANGYTGTLTAKVAALLGLKPVLAGRKEASIQLLANQLGMPFRVFDLADPRAVAQGLAGIDLVLHMAGPFSKTSAPMLNGCLVSKCHYMDITGEIQVFESIFARSESIKNAKIYAVPGVGFDVIPTDCVAAKLKAMVPDASRLELAFISNGALSPGTAKTMVEKLGDNVWIRRNGKLQQSPKPIRRSVDFGRGPKQVSAISWGDVATSYYTTHIPDITTYTAVPAVVDWLMNSPIRRIFAHSGTKSILQNMITKNIKGPSIDGLRDGRVTVWGRAESSSGTCGETLFSCVDGYRFTAFGALAAAKKLLNDEIAPNTAYGPHTPASFFGSEFAIDVDDLARRSPLPSPVSL